MKGVEAENYINDAKKKIAKTLRVQDKEILLHPAAQSRIILQ